MASNLLRKIPAVNELLEQSQLKSLVQRLSHSVVVNRVRAVLDEVRNEVQTAASERQLPSVGELADRIARRIMQEETPALRPVVNATGILLHTGLGRAPLADAAVEEMSAVARNYASVELDLPGGQRSQRIAAVENLLRELTGAEAAAVTNNNAGATMLTLAALAAGREVIVSRGQLIEIGGSFRLPDVMESSGATLRDVGTTNKTHLRDYEHAIGEATAALMHVHTSNFKVVGFSETPAIADLVALAQRRGLPMIDDIGSGALIDFSEWGFHEEPVARRSIETGADVVLFSGDKLLGGPQCGIIVGKQKFVQKIARHPMMRALRVDKLTLAGLAATLRLYRDEPRARREIPLLQLLCTSNENLKNRAERLAPQLAACSCIAAAEAIPDVSYLGGGSVPTQQIKTWCVALTPADGSVDRLAADLRTGSPSIVGRVQQNRLLFDLRSVFPRQDQELISAVQALSKSNGAAELPAPSETPAQ